MEKFKTPPDSPPVIVIDPDNQPMWSITRTVAPTLSSAIIQLHISNYFHIKGTYMQMIRDIQFDGRIRSDPHRHVANCVKISNLFKYGENQEEAVMLRTFSFSLSKEAKTWHGLTKSTIIQIFYHGLDDPTQRILDVRGIFLYKIPNEAFKILDDKVLLKLDFSDDSQNNPKPKIVVFAGGRNINSDHVILMEKIETLP
ncbi:hypothetical protein Tco_0126521 [Tanacetum coccineum]